MRLPRQALKYRPNRRRGIGRPKKRWRDQLHFEDKEQETCLTLHERDDDDDDDNNNNNNNNKDEEEIQSVSLPITS